MNKTLVSLSLFAVLAQQAWAGIWIESTQADFADGEYNTNIFTSASGNLRVKQDAIYDLNEDGNPDIIVCNMHDQYQNFNTPSFIYWGTDQGYDTLNRTALATYGATGNAVADLNDDGYLDIVFSSYDASGSSNSSIYWGSDQGFSEGNKTLLPTLGSHGVYVADLNDDHRLDIIFSNYGSGSFHEVNSFIYWGGIDGYSVGNRTELPTIGGISCSVADINMDGYLDIVFSNRQTSTVNCNIHSYIYWGSPSGYTPGNRDSLYTEGAYGNAVYDLNKDGFLDIIFCNHFNGATYLRESYIYWGDSTGTFSATRRTGLPTQSANSAAVADLNLDGWPDLVFANWKNDATYDVSSYIYWGSAQGFSAGNRTELPVYAATGVMLGKVVSNGTPGGGRYPDIVFTGNGQSYVYYGSPSGYSAANRTLLPCTYGHLSTKNIGNVHNRSLMETYISSVFDATQTSRWGTILHSGDTPESTEVIIYVRSGNSALPGSDWSPWAMVEAGSSIPPEMESQFIQYKLNYSTTGIRAPTTETISISFEPLGVAGGPQTTEIKPFLSIKPNPFKDVITVSMSPLTKGQLRISLYAIDGSRAYTTEVGQIGTDVGGAEIRLRDGRLSNLPVGVYILDAVWGECRATGKIVKMQ